MKNSSLCLEIVAFVGKELPLLANSYLCLEMIASVGTQLPLSGKIYGAC
jgi:hypothetical protein